MPQHQCVKDGAEVARCASLHKDNDFVLFWSVRAPKALRRERQESLHRHIVVVGSSRCVKQRRFCSLRARARVTCRKLRSLRRRP